MTMEKSDIQTHLTTRSVGRELIVLESVDSTNTYAKTLASGAYVHGTMVITDRQTAGRGRMGRSWVSTGGKDLTFSLILRPPVVPERLGVLSIATGLAIAESIRAVSGLPALCKWPNDVLLGGKKCSGVLAEGVLERGEFRAIVVGIGLNVNQPAFPPELNATSLALAGGREFDRFAVLNTLLGHLEQRIDQLERLDVHPLLDDWRGLNCMLGHEITVDQMGERIRGRAVDIDDDGKLVVSTDHDLVKFLAGDVHILS
jgi:BirA family biotin operon repressor/biotin-[acetyl-CoA-carboxylase] ligase